MKSKIQMGQLIIFMLLGLLIAVQFKSIQKENIQSKRQSDLTKLQEILSEQRNYSLTLTEQLKAKQKEVDDYEKTYLTSSDIQTLKTDLDSARFLAGMTSVRGPGIIITLDDSKIRLAEGVNPNNTIIHDANLSEIVNTLRAYGAQAISINDERLIATSEIQCAGPTVSVNNVRYAVPFVIKAIGDANYLEAIMKTPGNVIDIMATYGIQISIKKDNNIVVPSYNQINKAITITNLGG